MNNKITKMLITLIILLLLIFTVVIVVKICTQKGKTEKIEYVAELQNIAGSKKEEALKIEVKEKLPEPIKEETPILPMDPTYKGFNIIGKILIPKTGLDIPIINNVTVSGMNEAPCMLYTIGKVNKSGNTYIVGHNYRNNTLFSNNGNLEIGDKIYITILDNSQREYTIYNKFVTTPEDVSYLKREIENDPEITLQSCTDDDINRLIILAR